MNEVAIFTYGLAVFGIVSAACWLIVWGIINERRDREQLDAGPAARPPSPGASARTDAGGETIERTEAAGAPR